MVKRGCIRELTTIKPIRPRIETLKTEFREPLSGAELARWRRGTHEDSITRITRGGFD